MFALFTMHIVLISPTNTSISFILWRLKLSDAIFILLISRGISSHENWIYERQDYTIYKLSIKCSFSSIGQDKLKLQKQISKVVLKLTMLNAFNYLQNVQSKLYKLKDILSVFIMKQISVLILTLLIIWNWLH